MDIKTHSQKCHIVHEAAELTSYGLVTTGYSRLCELNLCISMVVSFGCGEVLPPVSKEVFESPLNDDHAEREGGAFFDFEARLLVLF